MTIDEVLNVADSYADTWHNPWRFSEADRETRRLLLQAAIEGVVAAECDAWRIALRERAEQMRGYLASYGAAYTRAAHARINGAATELDEVATTLRQPISTVDDPPPPEYNSAPVHTYSKD